MLDADNFYMLVGVNVNQFMFGGLGGAIGGLIAGAASQIADAGEPQPYQTTFGELPESLRRESDWGRVDRRATVLVVPRSSVEKVSLSFWTGCKLRTDQLKLFLPIPPWGYAKARRLLAKYNWGS